jgi:hypothetical protein
LEHDADCLEAVNQLLAFEQGSNSHDDFPDALEGAIFKLMRMRSTAGTGEEAIGRVKEKKRKPF